MTGIGELVPLTKDALLGAWRMTSWIYEIVGTGEKRDALGSDPRGWIVYSPERHPRRSSRFTTRCLLTPEPIPSIPTE
jgi:hypothetical protein